MSTVLEYPSLGKEVLDSLSSSTGQVTSPCDVPICGGSRLCCAESQMQTVHSISYIIASKNPAPTQSEPTSETYIPALHVQPRTDAHVVRVHLARHERVV